MVNQPEHRRAKKLTAMFILCLAVFGLGLQFFLIVKQHLTAGKPVLTGIINFFSYFTILTNILVGLVAAFTVFPSGNFPSRLFQKNEVQTAICAYILVVGIVYVTVLQNTWSPTGYQLVADILLHYVAPVTYFIYWALFVPGKRIAWLNIFYWLGYPLTYLLYALLRGEYSGWFAYPFLDSDHLSAKQIVINCATIAFGFIIIFCLLIGIKKWIANSPLKTVE